MRLDSTCEILFHVLLVADKGTAEKKLNRWHLSSVANSFLSSIGLIVFLLLYKGPCVLSEQAILLNK